MTATAAIADLGIEREGVELYGFEVHPAAGIFPLIDGDDFQRLVEDIRANGLADEVTLDSNGLLIDGRNRVRACAEAGVEVRTRLFDGDAVQYVVSHNLHRRHLTNQQRAMVAARLANLPHGGDRKSAQIKTPNGDLIPPTRSTVKELLGVSEGSLHRAKVIDREGSPSLIALADDGKVSLDAAATVATELDAAEQNAFVEQVRAGADPGKIAPKKAIGADQPSPKQPRRPGPPSTRHIIKVTNLRTIVTRLSGHQTAYEGITAVDPKLTSEEATRLRRDLSKSIAALQRLNRLIEERTK